MEVSPQLDSFRGFGLFFGTGLMYMHTQQTEQQQQQQHLLFKTRKQK
jgi:hypothetical protein